MTKSQVENAKAGDILECISTSDGDYAHYLTVGNKYVIEEVDEDDDIVIMGDNGFGETYIDVYNKSKRKCFKVWKDSAYLRFVKFLKE